jgi:hypothetical protein
MMGEERGGSASGYILHRLAGFSGVAADRCDVADEQLCRVCISTSDHALQFIEGGRKLAASLIGQVLARKV